MNRSTRICARTHNRRAPRRGVNPTLEGLEDRIVLYSTLGSWTYDSRITYSFMPDGTNVAGTPSSLFATLNAKFATATWEQQIETAASLWENVTGANVAQVSDGGEPFATQGDQQDDPRFGDIRIGAIPLSPGLLAETFVPPPGNGGTDAGDIFLNSNVNWQIGSSYDLMTVVAHEFGHALGLGESTVSSAVMYGTYNGIKTSLTTDDISGIQSIYGTRTPDQFNSNGKTDSSYYTAANISSYINGNDQLAIPALENMSSAGNEWYYVSAPTGTTSTMTVTVQSSNLSSFAPQLQVYSSSLSLLGHVSDPEVFGATISVTASNVTVGSGYYIRVFAAGGPGAIGSYGLLVNFSGQAQSPIAPPNTVVAQQPDQGGGTSNDNAPTHGLPGLSWMHLGSYSGWGDSFADVDSGSDSTVGATTQNTQSGASSTTLIGVLSVNSSGSGSSSSSSSASTTATAATTASALPLIVQAIDDVLSSLFS
jgi:hypothetical protein